MTDPGSEVTDAFLQLADELASSGSGPAMLQNARRRRAVSTAYYALFHALSSLCATTLAGDEQDARIVDLLYRALDHAELARTLVSPEAFRIAGALELVGDAFRDLLERRQTADYAPAAFRLEPHEAIRLVETAREAIGLLRGLTRSEKRRLAVLLIARSRSRQTRRP